MNWKLYGLNPNLILIKINFTRLWISIAKSDARAAPVIPKVGINIKFNIMIRNTRRTKKTVVIL